MTRISPVRRAALLATTLVAGLGGILATAGPGTASAPTSQQAQAAPRTSLTLVVRDCDRCTVQLVHAVTGQDHVWTSHVRRVGSDHQITFDLRTALTHGLSFVVEAPWAGNIGAVPNMVTRYPGHKVGTVIDRSDARAGKRAAGCWAGTGADSARLTFQVDRVSARTPDGHRTRTPLAYSARTLPSWQPYVRTYKGTIGNQDAFYCTQP